MTLVYALLEGAKITYNPIEEVGFFLRFLLKSEEEKNLTKMGHVPTSRASCKSIN